MADSDEKVVHRRRQDRSLEALVRQPSNDRVASFVMGQRQNVNGAVYMG